MGWFHKKPDPISERARLLNQEIAELESQIKELDAALQQQKDHPRLRSTAVPQGASVPFSPGPPQHPGAAHEPIFEEVDQALLKARGEAESTPDHYNDLGVRKYDLPALIRRIRTHFRGPATSNPKLVSYLAAGGIQGLRPLRYERRVARNRFIALAIVLFLILLGLLGAFIHHR